MKYENFISIKFLKNVIFKKKKKLKKDILSQNGYNFLLFNIKYQFYWKR